MADALDAVHRSGRTHGRLTPVNICEVQRLIKVDGAGLFCDVSPTVAMRVWRGLSCFWAPEVVRGETPTPAADVYSLAAIAAVLLSSGRSIDPHAALVDLKKENRPLHDTLEAAMSVSPDKRPLSPSLLVSRLSGAVEDDEMDEEPTTYFVKSPMDESEESDAERTGSERTVIDVQVPPEVASAVPPPRKGPGTPRASQSDVTVNTRAPTASGKLAARPKKKKGLKSHGRTVVARNKLVPGADAPRKVPAIVEMGAPVGPSGVRTQGKGANRPSANVPRSVDAAIDATERMDAQVHRIPGMATPSKNVPPTVAAGMGWAARPPKAKPVAKPRPVARPATRKPANPVQPGRPSQPKPKPATPPAGLQADLPAQSRPVGGQERASHPPVSRPKQAPERTPPTRRAAPEHRAVSTGPAPMPVQPAPEEGTNVLYIVLAAVVSATLACILTILLFGN